MNNTKHVIYHIIQTEMFGDHQDICFVDQLVSTHYDVDSATHELQQLALAAFEFNRCVTEGNRVLETFPQGTKTFTLLGRSYYLKESVDQTYENTANSML